VHPTKWEAVPRAGPRPCRCATVLDRVPVPAAHRRRLPVRSGVQQYQQQSLLRLWHLDYRERLGYRSVALGRHEQCQLHPVLACDISSHAWRGRCTFYISLDYGQTVDIVSYILYVDVQTSENVEKQTENVYVF
jgi:hypothetical protein